MPATRSLIGGGDELQIDFQNRVVFVRGEEVKLRPTEYRLLRSSAFIKRGEDVGRARFEPGVDTG